MNSTTSQQASLPLSQGLYTPAEAVESEVQAILPLSQGLYTPEPRLFADVSGVKGQTVRWVDKDCVQHRELFDGTLFELMQWMPSQQLTDLYMESTFELYSLKTRSKVIKAARRLGLVLWVRRALYTRRTADYPVVWKAPTKTLPGCYVMGPKPLGAEGDLLDVDAIERAYRIGKQFYHPLLAKERPAYKRRPLNYIVKGMDREGYTDNNSVRLMALLPPLKDIPVKKCSAEPAPQYDPIDPKDYFPTIGKVGNKQWKPDAIILTLAVFAEHAAKLELNRAGFKRLASLSDNHYKGIGAGKLRIFKNTIEGRRIATHVGLELFKHFTKLRTQARIPLSQGLYTPASDDLLQFGVAE